MKKFNINLKGRVKNFDLPENKSLFPLFEAVVNSLQAIEERKKLCPFEGSIIIKIEREETISNEVLGRINNICITDNGIGFNENNYNSFLESDSDYKNEIGGKGVGRFSWLKAFKSVSVDSCFEDNGHFYKRAFEFSLSNDGVDDTVIETVAEHPSTTIKLCSFIDNYKKNAPLKLEEIAIKMIQHCFVYFLSSDCPIVVLSDDQNSSINLNDLFKTKIILAEERETFAVENEKFCLTKLRVSGDIVREHKLYLCANNRLVETKDLSKSIIDLDKALGEGKKFWVLGIVTSPYLDNNVDMNRLSFSIPENADDGLYPIVTINKIVNIAVYEQHNLWLVDERLAYFFYAASDIPFNNDKKEDRPDLMLLDNSIALLESQNDGTAYDTIVLFELKKPMRNDLTTNNPVDQIIGYMEKIQSNKVTDRNGRIIRTDEHTKFYLYVVCDAIETYRNSLKLRGGFSETIDGLGMFRMLNNQYIEVLTYDKIINDAKKRNKILFDKLGI